MSSKLMSSICLMLSLVSLLNAAARSLHSSARLTVMQLEFDETQSQSTVDPSRHSANKYIQKNPLNSINPQQIKHVDYLIIGDWGGYSGVATKEYIQTLQSMKEFVTEHDASLNLMGILNTGDNFYDNGIASLEHPYINTIFRNPFRANFSGDHKFGNIGFFGVLGNHDWPHWQPQIQLTHLEYQTFVERQLFQRQSLYYPQWIIPDLWYAKRVRFSDKTILFLFFDTEIMDKTKPEFTQMQNKWIYRMFEQNERQVDHVFMIGHKPPFCTAKHNGNDHVLHEIEGIVRRWDWYYKRITFIGGHDHTFEGGTAVGEDQFSKLYLYNFVVGGTRDCSPDGHWIANIWTKRYLTHADHEKSSTHRNYLSNVWAGCRNGGFTHLHISEGDTSTKIDITMHFYSGDKQLLQTGQYTVRTHSMRTYQTRVALGPFQDGADGEAGHDSFVVVVQDPLTSKIRSRVQYEPRPQTPAAATDDDQIKWTNPTEQAASGHERNTPHNIVDLII